MKATAYMFSTRHAGVQKVVIGSAGDAGGQFNKPSGLAIKGDVLIVTTIVFKC